MYINNGDAKMNTTTVAEAGKKGGSVKSDAKTLAAQANAKKPRGKWVTSISFTIRAENGEIESGLLIKRGRLSADELVVAVGYSEEAKKYTVIEILEIESKEERIVF